jgi:formate dehydrogenase maturation protein FdhE
MTKLTEEQKKYYLEHKGTECPVCHSTKVAADHAPYEDDGGAFQQCYCEDCAAEWLEILTLTGIEDVE